MIKNKFRFNKYIFMGAIVGSMLSAGLIPSVGLAFPWDSKFKEVYTSLTGPVATCVSGAILIATGIAISSSEGGGAAKRGLQIIFGMTIMLCAAQFVDFFKS